MNVQIPHVPACNLFPLVLSSERIGSRWLASPTLTQRAWLGQMNTLIFSCTTPRPMFLASHTNKWPFIECELVQSTILPILCHTSITDPISHWILISMPTVLPSNCLYLDVPTCTKMAKLHVGLLLRRLPEDPMTECIWVVLLSSVHCLHVLHRKCVQEPEVGLWLMLKGKVSVLTSSCCILGTEEMKTLLIQNYQAIFLSAVYTPTWAM